jgi:hypothetical protein
VANAFATTAYPFFLAGEHEQQRVSECEIKRLAKARTNLGKYKDEEKIEKQNREQEQEHRQ